MYLTENVCLYMYNMHKYYFVPFWKKVAFNTFLCSQTMLLNVAIFNLNGKTVKYFMYI